MKPRSAFGREALGRRELLGEREVGAVREVVPVHEEELRLAGRRVVELELEPRQRLRRHRDESIVAAMARIPLLAGTRPLIATVPDDAVVLRPPPPGAAVADVGAAVRDALRFPLEGEPLEALVRRRDRATIVVEPPALPIPGARLIRASSRSAPSWTSWSGSASRAGTRRSSSRPGSRGGRPSASSRRSSRASLRAASTGASSSTTPRTRSSSASTTRRVRRCASTARSRRRTSSSS